MHVICKDGKYLLERGIVIRWCQETDMSSLMRLCVNAFCLFVNLYDVTASRYTHMSCECIKFCEYMKREKLYGNEL